MATKANIVIADGDAANHTFSPSGMEGANRDIHLFTEAGTDGSPITESKLTYRKSVLADGAIRHTYVLRRPQTTTVDGSLVETGYTQGRLTIDGSANSTIDERDDTRVILSNLLLNSQVVDNVTNNKDMWG